jgi:acyl-CoA synthetase (AMP-forming)/AMP-acid ligase II
MHLTDLYFRGLLTHPDRLALSGDGGEFTYRQAWRQVCRIARRLHESGFGPGERFAVLSPNTGQALLAMLGAMRAGVAWSNLNMRAAPADILHILSAGRCGLLFFDPAAAPLIDAIRAGVPTLREVVCLGDDPRAPSLEAWLGEVSDEPLDLRLPENVQGFQGATGGTTGRSKLTVGSNRSILTSVLAWATCLHFDEPPVNLAVAPISHVAGTKILPTLQRGGTVQLLPLQGHGHDVKIDARYLLAARHGDDAPRAVARAFYRALLFHDLATLTELAFDARGVEVLAEGSAPPPGEQGQLELVVDVLALAELAVGEPFPTPSGLQFVTPRHREMGIRVYRGLVPDGELPFLLRQRDSAWKVIPFHFVQAVVVARGGTLRPATGSGGTATQTP